MIRGQHPPRSGAVPRSPRMSDVCLASLNEESSTSDSFVERTWLWRRAGDAAAGRWVLSSDHDRLGFGPRVRRSQSDGRAASLGLAGNGSPGQHPPPCRRVTRSNSGCILPQSRTRGRVPVHRAVSVAWRLGRVRGMAAGRFDHWAPEAVSGGASPRSSPRVGWFSVGKAVGCSSRVWGSLQGRSAWTSSSGRWR